MATAALAAHAQREIQHQFFAADAVRPDRAIPFEPADGFEERQFARLRERGAIREDVGGRYWLDLHAYDVELRERHRRVRLALIAVALVFGGYMVITGAIAAGLIAQ